MSTYCFCKIEGPRMCHKWSYWLWQWFQYAWHILACNLTKLLTFPGTRNWHIPFLPFSKGLILRLCRIIFMVIQSMSDRTRVLHARCCLLFFSCITYASTIIRNNKNGSHQLFTWLKIYTAVKAQQHNYYPPLTTHRNFG